MPALALLLQSWHACLDICRRYCRRMSRFKPSATHLRAVARKRNYVCAQTSTCLQGRGNWEDRGTMPSHAPENRPLVSATLNDVSSGNKKCCNPLIGTPQPEGSSQPMGVMQPMGWPTPQRCQAMRSKTLAPSWQAHSALRHLRIILLAPRPRIARLP